MEYGDVQRATVQLFMSKKLMTEKDVQDSVRKLFAEYKPGVTPPNTPLTLAVYFNAINEEIGTAGVAWAEIKRIRHEDESAPYWGLSSIAVEEEGGEEAGAAPKELRWLTSSQLELFKRVLDALVSEPAREGLLDYNVALNMRELREKPSAPGDAPPPKFPPLTGVQASKTLDLLVEGGWIKYVHTGAARGSHTDKKITLGMRSLLDLRRYIETRCEAPCCAWTSGGDFKWTFVRTNPLPNNPNPPNPEQDHPGPANPPPAPPPNDGDTEDEDEEPKAPAGGGGGGGGGEEEPGRRGGREGGGRGAQEAVVP